MLYAAILCLANMQIRQVSIVHSKLHSQPRVSHVTFPFAYRVPSFEGKSLLLSRLL